MKKMELNAGNTIFKKGDPADGLYIVGKGSVGIYFPTNHTMEKPDIVLKANDILGEMGVIDTAPRTVSYTHLRSPRDAHESRMPSSA